MLNLIKNIIQKMDDGNFSVVQIVIPPSNNVTANIETIQVNYLIEDAIHISKEFDRFTLVNVRQLFDPKFLKTIKTDKVILLHSVSNTILIFRDLKYLTDNNEITIFSDGDIGFETDYAEYYTIINTEDCIMRNRDVLIEYFIILTDKSTLAWDPLNKRILTDKYYDKLTNEEKLLIELKGGL